MIWNTQVSAWKMTDSVSRLLQMKTSSEMMLVAMIVCPTITANSDTIRMTSMARSRVAGVFASTSAGLGNSAATFMPQI